MLAMLLSRSSFYPHQMYAEGETSQVLWSQICASCTFNICFLGACVVLLYVGPITMERRYIGVKLPILGEINKEAGSSIGLCTILYTFLLYLEFLILVYIKSSSYS